MKKIFFINVTDEYKNVKAQKFELPNLTVLTGKNGAGKSNFFNTISNNYPKSHATVYFDEIVIEKNQILSKRLGDFLNSNSSSSNSDFSLWELLNAKKELNSIHRQYAHQQNTWYKLVLQDIAVSLGKKDSELTDDEAYEFYHFSVLSVLIKSTLFDLSLKQFFISYVEARKKAQLIKTATESNSDYCIPYKDIYLNFLERYTIAPWLAINDAMEDSGLGYRITEPDEKDLKKFTPKLVNIKSGYEISVDELSSGEKILFKLSLALFSGEKSQKFPKVLLLDEVDASLHPEMIVRYFDIIQKTFIGRYNIKVIVATHSPTTVAIVPEDNLYKIENGFVTPSSKRDSLSSLLSGVPNLTIFYENIKQVFVESKYDVEFYTTLDDILMLKDKVNSILNFISSGSDGSGSSTQVKSIVKELNDKGVPSVYGLIDRDEKNRNSNNVYTLGDQNRYSRENYTFDPLYVGFVVIYNNYFLANDSEWFKELTITQLANADNSLLQKIYDYMLAKLPLQRDKDSSTPSSLQNGFTIDTSKHLMNMNGHELAEMYFNSYPPLKRLKKSTEYERDLYSKVFRNFSQFIYKDIYDTLYLIHAVPLLPKV